MGKGDKKSKRGKIIIKSYGVRRPRRKAGFTVPETKATEPVTVKQNKEKPTVKPVAEPVTALDEAPVLELTGEADIAPKKKSTKAKAAPKKEEKPE